MTKENSSRLHAFNIIWEFESSKNQLKSIRRKYFKLNNTSIDERNRSMVLTNEVVRWQRRIDTWISLSLDKPIKKLHPKVLCILRMGYYEYVMDDSVPPHAAVDSWVELSKKIVNKKLSGLINAVLRKASYIDKQTPIKNQNI
ncbi:MAG: transcription antitermination protein NusB, partial [Candidatus Neomarinimicrobiota bacterium]|nr:transcription antitermination protein NusB [Candidatus Neomarinimicrobiota bacterium]